MEVSYKEEVSVGALVILGLVAFPLGMFWLTGRSIVSKGIGVDVVFKDVSGLKEGDPVSVWGARMRGVAWVHMAMGGKVIVTMQLRPDVRPHARANAAVAAADF